MKINWEQHGQFSSIMARGARHNRHITCNTHSFSQEKNFIMGCQRTPKAAMAGALVIFFQKVKFIPPLFLILKTNLDCMNGFVSFSFYEI